MWQLTTDVRTGSRRNFACKNKSIVRGLAYHRRLYRALEAAHRMNWPEQKLLIEPWFRNLQDRSLCQPDAVLVEPESNTGIVIEVKMNWKDGRDQKLLDLYLDAAQHALGLDCTWPALITGNVRGLSHKPLLGLSQLPKAAEWVPGQPTPVLLVP